MSSYNNILQFKAYRKKERCITGYTYYSELRLARIPQLFCLGETIELVQIYDSTYISYRFHLSAHLSAYMGMGAFLGGVKIESAKTIGIGRYSRLLEKLPRSLVA
jgi:hypothetical protein